jgi:hypothetical protein
LHRSHKLQLLAHVRKNTENKTETSIALTDLYRNFTEIPGFSI